VIVTTKPTGHQTSTAIVMTPDQLLQHWQGHRRLTRRVIEAFPEDQLFTFSVGGMRPFSVIAVELIFMGAPMIRGFATGQWDQPEVAAPTTRAGLLRLWDDATTQLDAFWSRLAPERFQENDTAFGQWPGRVYDLIFYAIDNEIHHRGQGYVYLRSLGIEPPAFPDRS
jgi:uncharacterized damage-inducible protein DinB